MAKKIIELRNIVKKFDDEVVVNNLNLYVNENEFITLVGPSGCGKTTTLRIIGGFETPDSGEIILNGEVVKDLPPYQRPINTVFQRYALFPHLNVFDNIAFGLRNFNRIYEELKSEVRKQYEQERRTLQRKLSDRALSKAERQEIKSRLRAIRKEIRERIIEEKEKLIEQKLQEIEERYTEKSKKLKRALRKRRTARAKSGKLASASRIERKVLEEKKTIDFGPRTEARM